MGEPKKADFTGANGFDGAGFKRAHATWRKRKSRLIRAEAQGQPRHPKPCGCAPKADGGVGGCATKWLDSWTLKFAAQPLCADKEVVLAAVQQHIAALDHVDQALISQRNFVNECVSSGLLGCVRVDFRIVLASRTCTSDLCLQSGAKAPDESVQVQP